MPSARSASWPNQGLSGTARHFPGLGILPHVVQPRPVTIGRAAQPDLPRQSVERPADVAAIQPVTPA
jgi:hypothetical protein